MTPVMFPPGRARLSINPPRTGSVLEFHAHGENEVHLEADQLFGEAEIGYSPPAVNHSCQPRKPSGGYWGLNAAAFRVLEFPVVLIHESSFVVSPPEPENRAQEKGGEGHQQNPLTNPWTHPPFWVASHYLLGEQQ